MRRSIPMPIGTLRLPVLLVTIALLAVMTMTTACTPGRQADPLAFTGPKPQGPTPAYAELAALHHRRLANISQFTAQAQVELFYHDPKGRRHFEQADQARVVLVRPDHLAVLIRKFGAGDLFWAGSDSDHYWLFDLTDSRHRLLYVGSHHAVDDGQARPLPVPVQPRDLPRLMGLATLPDQGQVRPVRGGYLVQPQLVQPQDARWQMLMDPATSLPVRVDLLDAKGRPAVTALLSRPRQIETFERSIGAWPFVMSRIEIRTHDSQDYLVVYLADLNDGRESDTISDRLFDLPRLRRIYKPDEVINLDQP